MTTTDSSSAVAIANARQHLDGCEARLVEATRVRDEAHRALASFPPVEAGRAAKIKLAVLTAEAAVDEADARWQECGTVHAAARTMWETLVRQAYVAREIARVRAALATTQTLATDLRAGLVDRQAVARQLGVVDSGSHPAAHVVPFVEALEAHLRQLDPPPPGPTPPPPPGQVRVRALVHFSDAVERWRHEPNTVVCLPADEAKQVIEKGWAVPVEA